MCNGAARNRAQTQRLVLLLLIMLVTRLTACRAAATAAGPAVKIGLVAPFEGRARSVGYDAIYAARLAVREINEDGGAGGRAVALVAVDDSADVDLARQAAASLVVDPAVVAVVGHWQEETTAAAQTLYDENDLALIVAGRAPFDTVDAGLLPPDFVEKYAAVTPFDEVAGAYAGPTYDAFYLLFEALELAESSGQISRESVAVALEGLQYDGVTGSVFRP